MIRLSVSDGRIFWSALLGLIGIPLECLCYFGIYRMIAPYSSKFAHAYRSGIFGVLIFGIALAVVFKLFNTELTNALATGWISLGNLWMFGGLLVVSRKMK